ncbi:LssY C-terminal domain-containing protein [Paludisphaera rhizosphaerae]|uniref:LssY C-terminal domain-containing protein n=1 Tax=Paludisphaera rhizosphaerae TaxID=2711216 RepID=UPI00197FB24F|nr:LssY C-terminal domain-containing protein [Paludisphaera rhizosphaerae]
MADDQHDPLQNDAAPAVAAEIAQDLSETAPAPEAEAAAVPALVRSWKRRWSARTGKFLAYSVVFWLIVAYVVAPFFWTHYEHHPAMMDAPRTTLTAQGIPGDPLNVGLIGTREELVKAMHAAGWDPADPVTLRTSLEIAGSVIRGRPYNDAPVSPLFVFGRKQDLAFEKPVGDSAKQRHHVRFWESKDLGRDGMPLWIGAVTFDRSVGLSHRTGQITHHIAPDVDDERNGLFADLRGRDRLSEIFQVTGVGATLIGRNGGGDPYYTDGEMTIGVLTAADRPDSTPETLANPPVIRFKEQLWSAVKPILDSLPANQPDAPEDDDDQP